MTNNNNNNTFSPKKAESFALTAVRSSPGDPKASFNEIREYLLLPLPNFPKETIEPMPHSLLSKALSQIEAEEATFTRPSLTEEESENITKLFKENAQGIKDALMSEPNGEVFRVGKDPIVNLMVAFTAHALSNYHPSGWIKYDKKEIIALARLTKLTSAEQEKLTQALHSSFGVDMRVVGSAQPIPCYALPWLSSPQENTPVHLIGLENVYSELITLLTKGG